MRLKGSQLKNVKQFTKYFENSLGKQHAEEV
jgi:hypothetical protein